MAVICKFPQHPALNICNYLYVSPYLIRRQDLFPPPKVCLHICSTSCLQRPFSINYPPLLRHFQYFSFRIFMYAYKNIQATLILKITLFKKTFSSNYFPFTAQLVKKKMTASPNSMSSFFTQIAHYEFSLYPTKQRNSRIPSHKFMAEIIFPELYIDLFSVLWNIFP